MEVAFYFCGLVALLATLGVITNTNPIHALLYLIVSILALSGIFFALGAYFAGALEIIIYAGAIMVLFVFVVMMLNLGDKTIKKERNWLKTTVWLSPVLLSILLLLVLVYNIISSTRDLVAVGINGTIIDAKAVGISLFSSYLIAVELVSILLLAGLIIAFHIGREHHSDKIYSNYLADKAKIQKDEHL